MTKIAHVGTMRPLSVLLLGMLAGCHPMAGPDGPYFGFSPVSCDAISVSNYFWSVDGRFASLVEPLPDQSWVAVMSVGESVEVTLSAITIGNDCGDRVAAVTWLVSDGTVVQVTPKTRLTATLRATVPGEAVLAADASAGGAVVRVRTVYDPRTFRVRAVRVVAR